MACRNPIGIFQNKLTGETVPASCRTWTCEDCGPMKVNQLLDDVSYGGAVIQASGRRWRFLTLTTGPGSDQDDFSLYWRRFRATIRKHGYRPEFFKVTEFTEKGRRHYHVLVSVFIPWGLIKWAWYCATDKTAYVVFIKKTQVKNAAGYMAKYMTKQSVMSHQFRKHERRYSFSMGFPRMPTAPPSEEWQFTYKPDNSEFLKAGLRELHDVIREQTLWRDEWRSKIGLMRNPHVWNPWAGH